MDLEITIKNYRCFSDEKPARLVLRKGFPAFVGVNNSGKSSLLKLLISPRLYPVLLAKHPDVLLLMLATWLHSSLMKFPYFRP